MELSPGQFAGIEYLFPNTIHVPTLGGGAAISPDSLSAPGLTGALDRCRDCFPATCPESF